MTRNGSTSTRPIPKSELEGPYSCTFLWEKTKFADNPNHIYLLMADMEEHPDVDLNNPKVIDPSWVLKFHIHARK